MDHRLSGNSNRRVFVGQRFVVLEWQLESLMRLLGPKNYETVFPLDEWFDELDRRVVDSGEIVPQRESWAWLEEHTIAEARRRGLAMQTAESVKRARESEAAWLHFQAQRRKEKERR